MIYNIKKNFSKIYLKTYAFIVFIMIFILDSQIREIIPPVNTIGIIAIFSTIVINLFLIFGINDFKFYSNDIFFSLLIVILTIIPRLFNVQIMSPFFTMLYLMIINAKYVNPDKFIKVDFNVRTFSILLIIILYFLHLFNDNTITRGGTTLRYSIGFNDANMAGIVFLSLLLSFILALRTINNHLLRVMLTIIIIVIFACVVIVTDSRELEIPGVLLLVLSILKNINIVRNVIFKLSIPILILSILISIIVIFVLNSDSSLFYSLDQLTNYRASAALSVFNIYHISLFGHIDTSLLNNSIVNINGMKPGLDNTYLSNLFDFGIIGSFLLTFTFIKGISILKKYKNYTVNACLIVIFVTFIVAQGRDLYAPLIYAFTLNNSFRKEDNYE